LAPDDNQISNGKIMRLAFFAVAIAGSVLLMAVRPGLGADLGAGNLGSIQCERYLATLRQAPEKETVYYAWAQGFMTALNQDLLAAEPAHYFDVLDDPAGQRANLRTYCEAHPQAPFGDAVNALFQRLPFVDNKKPPPPH
jgi:hypothetical protein